jgi:hypothetical protein
VCWSGVVRWCWCVLVAGEVAGGTGRGDRT